MASNQIIFMCWINERIHSEENWSCWNRMFMVLKGADCYLFEQCDIPKSVADCNKCVKVYRVYESLFKLMKVKKSTFINIYYCLFYAEKQNFLLKSSEESHLKA